MISRRIRIEGVVQGVGFRPFVWRLAQELGLKGWVRNDAEGVEIEAYGSEKNVSALVRRLRDEAPELARIDALSVGEPAMHCAVEDFCILNSRGGRAGPMVAHDTAVCRDCLAELFDPENRRWRYPFSYCTHCGPRYTICRGLPFARERTAYKPFVVCGKCQNDYRRSGGRHFQNEIVSCPRCGPRVQCVDAEGVSLVGDPVARALGVLKSGGLLAIKGQGGFYLTCDAKNAAAVARLRQRKRCPGKPFTVMYPNTASVSAYVYMGVGEPGLLAMPERPIILLKKRSNCDEAFPGVSPGFVWQSVMLPCTPLHYLLFHEAAGQPPGTAWLESPQELALAVTRAGPESEPLIVDNQGALEQLSGVADAFLWHDLEIVARCENSVARSGPGGLQFIRRARGYAPRAIRQLRSGPPVLAVGGHFKNTICVTRGDEAFMSPHIGNLDDPAVIAYFEESIGHLLKALEVKPALVAHDADRSMPATRFALDFAQQKGIPSLAVNRYHAQVAAVLAEHQIEGPAFGLALDGDGSEAVGGLRGGALLAVDGVRVRKAGRLRPFLLPGEPSLNEPWELTAATSCVAHAGPAEAFRQGCYVNAVADLLGVKPRVTYPGQAVKLLEGLAEQYGEAPPIPGGWLVEAGWLDLSPMLRMLADERDPARGAACFHATLAAALADWIARHASPGSTVVGSGSCLLNLVLARGLRQHLGACGLHLIEARRLPPNEGGLALGQAWVAQHYLRGGGSGL